MVSCSFAPAVESIYGKVTFIDNRRLWSLVEVPTPQRFYDFPSQRGLVLAYTGKSFSYQDAINQQHRYRLKTTDQAKFFNTKYVRARLREVNQPGQEYNQVPRDTVAEAKSDTTSEAGSIEEQVQRLSLSGRDDVKVRS